MNETGYTAPDDGAIERFIERWRDARGAERSNYQLFVGELAVLLALPTPDPARNDTRDNAYVFERQIEFAHGDGTTSYGYADCYRRGAFVLEAKRVRQAEGPAFDDAMLRARSQAEQYARALPPAEGRPPFLLVVDVGNAIEVYAEFTRTGGTYTPFPDPRSHRIRIADLHDPDARNRLRRIWLDPLGLDPARQSARVTREIAERLAVVAKSLEGKGHPPSAVASFLGRCLFTMFAEDIGLLPRRAFADLFDRFRDDPPTLGRMLGALWTDMDRGGFCAALATDLLRFNGKLFKEREVLPLEHAHIDELSAAARADWRHVEPSIFGTLLERALDPDERHALGAHYTPRAYVERLVLPTIVEPLRDDWATAQAAALVLIREGKQSDACAVVREYLHKLAAVRVLDPACGSGNFLYVTLEHLKRLEGEVLNQLDAFGDTQGRLELAGVTVDPHQLLGIEINPRAAAIAEMVLWIGYLQWHYRTRGNINPPEPVLKDFRNIECRDAVLGYDRVEFVSDERGIPVTRWDGKTMKSHPVTGLKVPDERAQVPLEQYINPRRSTWPKADFVVGNPPFVGTKRMRQFLGDGYVDALRRTWKDVPNSADFVMYWWQRAAELVADGQLVRFGLITPNTVTQAFNREVVTRHLKPDHLSLIFAIPDHPWVDNVDGASVRIGMTVAVRGSRAGRLLRVVSETPDSDGSVSVQTATLIGKVHANLRIGADVSSARPLKANSGISGMGVALHGSGFIVDPSDAQRLAANGRHVIRPYLGGQDLLQVPRLRYLIDFSGLSEAEARRTNPAAFQWVIDHVKSERDFNQRRSIRELWWRFGWERPLLRKALSGLSRYIGTTESPKHRVFRFIDGSVLADHMVICFALSGGYELGVLSSRVHSVWVGANAGSLGGYAGSIRYNKNRCFDPFPFPSPLDASRRHIGTIAEEIDQLRTTRQQAHAGLTVTGIYNVLENLRRGVALDSAERLIHDNGLVSVLRELHDELDRAVFDAYGWGDLGERLVGRPGATAPWADKPDDQLSAEEELLGRLATLNAERATEEERGTVRWLRPEFQATGSASEAIPVQTVIDTGVDVEATTVLVEKRPWPAGLPDQLAAVLAVVADARSPIDEAALVDRFTGRGPWKRRMPTIVETLVAVGRVRRHEGRVVLADRGG